MHIGRFLDPSGRPRLGRLEGEMVQPLIGDIFAEFQDHGQAIPLADIRLLPPVMPSKVIGIGSNYRKHIEEMGRKVPETPKIFLKPGTSVVGPGVPISIPPLTQRVDHEGELAVVIGRHTSQVSPEESMGHILGFTCANDVTARDFQRADGVFTRGKGFDSFCPLGPWILKSQKDLDRYVRCWVDGELRQDGQTADMIFSVPQLISFVSHVMTLLPGDVISTGTPSGVGPIKSGQLVEVEVEGVGRLQNPVINRSDRTENAQ